MYPTEVEKGHLQVNGGFQVVQRFAEAQRKTRKAPEVCPNAQVGPFNVTGRDITRIRVSADWDRDCGFYVRGAVPVRGFSVRRAIEFEKLGKVNVSPKVIFDGGNIASQSVSRDLKPSNNPLAQIADKIISTHGVTFRSQVGQNEFGFTVDRHPDVGIAPLARIVRSKMLFLGVDEGPQLIGFHKSRMNSAHSAVKDVSALLPDSQKQGKNRALVDAYETRYGTDAHSFHKQTDYLRCFFSLNVVPSKWTFAGFGKRGFAGRAAKTLDSIASLKPKSLCFGVLTTDTCHIRFSLVFLREKPDNQSLGSECGLRPRLDSVPPLAQTSGGVLVSTKLCYCSHRCSPRLINSLIREAVPRALFCADLDHTTLVCERFHHSIQSPNAIARLLQPVADFTCCYGLIVAVGSLCQHYHQRRFAFRLGLA